MFQCRHSQIARGVDTLGPIAAAMKVELNKHAEAIDEIEATASTVTEQAEVNNTRASRFLRRRF